MLTIQVAGSAGGYLLEHLLIESIGATRGGGIFAWANVGGATTLFEDDTFEHFLTEGDYRLFVGTDTITDTPAVEKLVHISSRQPRFTARASLSPTSSLFHPKLAWFEHDDHLSLIVGSGNLTMGGLRSNWEAFVVERLEGDPGTRALEAIEGFIADQAHHLAPVTDQRVLDRVSRNTGMEQSLRHVPQLPAEPVRLRQLVDEVLVADMNRTEARLAQANFKVKDYEGFFGAQRGSQHRVWLRLVDSHGSVGDVQSRPSVEVRSRNYRFELDGLKAAHLGSSGRPVGVFLRLSTSEFAYMLVRPEDVGFPGLNDLLEARSTERSNQLRRIRISVEELSAAWPTAPILTAVLPAS